jgi:hypothetical protein
MDTEHIHIVTAPRQVLPVGANRQACEIVDGTVGAVIAGNPLRIFEGERTCAHRYFQTGMQQVARCIAEIHVQQNRGGKMLRLFLRMATSGQKSEQTAAKNAACNACHHL